MGVPSASDKDFSLHVVNAKGRNVQGAALWLVRDYREFPAARGDGSNRSINVTTDAAGLAKVKFPAAPTNVMVTAKDLAPVFLRAADLGKTQPFEIRMEEGQTVRGTVVDGAGKPVENVIVRGERMQFVMSYANGFSFDAVSDQAGRFEASHVGAAQYQVDGPYS